MKAEELRKKKKGELSKILGERKEKLRLMRFDLAMGKLKNVREVRKVRKDIARILTLQKSEKK